MSLAASPEPAHIGAMNAIAEALNVPIVPDFIRSVESRLLREFAAAVQDWSNCAPTLTQWEDEHLLDNPEPEMLARHKATVERLLRFGAFLALATEHPDFPEPELGQIVSATQQDLRDRLAMWHGPRMSKEESERILAACFPEQGCSKVGRGG
jgi:hypothetical protein